MTANQESTASCANQKTLVYVITGSEPSALFHAIKQIAEGKAIQIDTRSSNSLTAIIECPHCQGSLAFVVTRRAGELLVNIECKSDCAGAEGARL